MDAARVAFIQAIEITALTVALTLLAEGFRGNFEGKPMRPNRHFHEATTLYSPQGARKYLNADERRRILAVLPQVGSVEALFVGMLFWTGARLSEVLAVRRSDFQRSDGIVSFRTLKRRCISYREIPLPSGFVDELDRTFDLSAAGEEQQRLWPVSRVSGWRYVRQVTALAKVHGAAGSPKGLRHGFAVASVQAGVPLNLVQRWLGHSRMSTTAIYAAVIGAEERYFVELLWRGAVSPPESAASSAKDR